MKTVIVRELDDLDIALRVIRAHHDQHGETQVVIKNVDESITDAQRAYHFVLCGIIGADLGNTKDEQHQYFKERFLLNIYIADIENHPEFAGVEERLRRSRSCLNSWSFMVCIHNGNAIIFFTMKI